MQRSVIAALADLPDDALRRPFAAHPLQFHLYAALRREQRAVVSATADRDREPPLILRFARSAFEELVALLAGRELLDSVRDGEWTLRDLLRHAIAVELRYCDQVLWSAQRRDDEPLAIPAERLSCDRLTPPSPEFADAERGDTSRVVELLGRARARTDVCVGDLPRSSLNRPSLWGTMEVDVRERLHQIAVHLVEVIVQAEKMLGEREPEPRRIVRRITAAREMHERLSPAIELRRLDDELEKLVRG